MRFNDYEWELYPQNIVFDRELDMDNLGWQRGDLFKLIVEHGHTKLVKIDPLVKFLEDGVDK